MIEQKRRRAEDKVEKESEVSEPRRGSARSKHQASARWTRSLKMKMTKRICLAR